MDVCGRGISGLFGCENRGKQLVGFSVLVFLYCFFLGGGGVEHGGETLAVGKRKTDEVAGGKLTMAEIMNNERRTVCT